MIVLQRLEAIQKGLRILRSIILLLATAQLFLSLFNSNADFLVSLIISLIAVILYLQKHLSPASYRLFILLLLIDLIYSGGHFAQKIFQDLQLSFIYILLNSFTFFVITLFVVVLWRHYQLSQVTELLQFQQIPV